MPPRSMRPSHLDGLFFHLSETHDPTVSYTVEANTLVQNKAFHAYKHLHSQKAKRNLQLADTDYSCSIPI